MKFKIDVGNAIEFRSHQNDGDPRQPCRIAGMVCCDRNDVNGFFDDDAFFDPNVRMVALQNMATIDTNDIVLS